MHHLPIALGMITRKRTGINIQLQAECFWQVTWNWQIQGDSNSRRPHFFPLQFPWLWVISLERHQQSWLWKPANYEQICSDVLADDCLWLGKLPRLRRLMDTGLRGVLICCTIPNSSVVSASTTNGTERSGWKNRSVLRSSFTSIQNIYHIRQPWVDRSTSYRYEWNLRHWGESLIDFGSVHLVNIKKSDGSPNLLVDASSV